MIYLHLVTGLLGSGKTTLIQQLLHQKPTDERWGVLINDFGPFSLDDALLRQDDVPLISIQGGCLCCSAQLALQQALNQLRQQGPFDHILVEPTGLGHPAAILDTLARQPDMQVRSVTTLFTPNQLTPDRWQRSDLMRDLASLAHTVILNKCDLADQETIRQARSCLESLPRPPFTLIETTHGKVNADQILDPPPPPHPFFWQQDTRHHQCRPPVTHETSMPGVQTAYRMEDEQHLSLSWQIHPDWLFPRPCLKTLFNQQPPVRAKGLVRTGRDWQLLQFADGQLSLTPFAWRQDSRLMAFFTSEEAACLFEKQLAQCLLHRSRTAHA